MKLKDTIALLTGAYNTYLKAGRDAEAAAYMQGFHDGVDCISKSLPEPVEVGNGNDES